MKSFQPGNLVSFKVLPLFCYLYTLFRANSLIILRIPYQHFDNNTKIFYVSFLYRGVCDFVLALLGKKHNKILDVWSMKERT